MLLPVYLPQGWASLYGFGTVVSKSGIIPNSASFRFATIYGLGDCNTGAQVGDSVMFNMKDVKCVLAFGSGNYTMIEQSKLAITENLTILS